MGKVCVLVHVCSSWCVCEHFCVFMVMVVCELVQCLCVRGVCAVGVNVCACACV